MTETCTPLQTKDDLSALHQQLDQMRERHRRLRDDRLGALIKTTVDQCAIRRSLQLASVERLVHVAYETGSESLPDQAEQTLERLHCPAWAATGTNHHHDPVTVFRSFCITCPSRQKRK